MTAPVIPVISGEAVLSAVTPAEAIERTREAFERHARGEWVMPAKVYLDSPPGDFRAMPARGSGVALLKWVTSYPHNPERGLPVVTGVIVLSDADSGAELAILDALRQVVDPEIGMNVIELALIRQVLLGDQLTEVKMILTTPFCPYAGAMLQQVKEVVEEVEGHDVKVTLLAERWDPKDAGLVW